MKFSMFLVTLFAVHAMEGQTGYLLTESNVKISGDFLFRTPDEYYFISGDTIYKSPRVEGVRYFGSIQTIPSSSAYEDLYEFGRKGRNSAQLYLSGSLLMLGGGAFLFTDLEAVGLILSSAGLVFSISGFFTNLSAWKYGERATIKLTAIDYLQ